MQSHFQPIHGESTSKIKYLKWRTKLKFFEEKKAGFKPTIVTIVSVVGEWHNKIKCKRKIPCYDHHIHSSILLKLFTFFSICDNSFVTTSSNNWWAPTQGIWGTRMLTQLTLQKSNKGWMKETGLVAQLTSILSSSLIDNQWIWIFLHKKYLAEIIGW